ASVERGDLRLELRIQGSQVLLNRGHRLLCASNVTALLENAPGVPCRCRRTTDVGRADRLSPEQPAEDRGADGNRRLHGPLGGLPTLPGLRLLGTAEPLLEGSLLGRVLLAKRFHAPVAVGPRRLADPHPKVPLALAGLGKRARRRVTEEFEPA